MNRLYGLKKQQENYTYSLDFTSYKATRESNKTYSERFKKLGDYESSLEFQWLPEAGLQAEVNDDLIIKRKRWQKSLKKGYLYFRSYRNTERFIYST